MKVLEEKTNQQGQAILEYVLALSMMFGLMTLIMTGIKTTRDRTWKKIICDVAAMCHDCKPPESVNQVIPSQGPCK